MSGAFSSPPPRQPPVDPRFRRRWAEARRAEGRRRLHVLVAAVVVMAVLGGTEGLLHSPLLDVRHVRVVGAVHTPRVELLAAAGLSRSRGGALMVDAGSHAAVRAVDALPWVGGVSFRRYWPWTVVMRVRERVPVALVRAGHGGPDLVDRTGRVLEVVPASERLRPLPVILGVRKALPGRRVRPTRGTSGADLNELLAAAAAAPTALARAGLEIVVRPGVGLVAEVGPTKALVLLGEPSELGFKWAVLESLVKAVQVSGYSEVDLTVPERPALTPVPGPGTTTPGT
ncbi:MAG: cell division protein FtsQ/DivIB [Acidimicrobiales bacterium]